MASQFRGWYFKCQSKEHTLALIPAIHQGPQGRECSLQLISPENSQTVSLPSQGATLRWDRPEGQMNGFSFSPKAAAYIPAFSASSCRPTTVCA